ncbi:MAG TPA: helix-turn-helix domain-containing protein [Pseudonocardiaceae bacterium]|jgi:transcriptional regulator with XRE-family HTH domain|nr:helix-turn-helix domain-containing protein [Pseudonocardiaceae bacterium]
MVRLPLTPEQLAAGKRLGSYLRRSRGERTLVDVARAAAISPETLRKIETGRMATPAFTTVAALAHALAVPLDDLAHICLARADLEKID